MPDFLSRYFPLAIFVFVVGTFGYRAWSGLRGLRAQGLPVRPSIPADALFGETRASGRIVFESLLSGFGGANRCLLVWVTRREFVVEVAFPFNLLTYSMESIPRTRVPVASISSARRIDGRIVELTFPGSDRKLKTIRLALADAGGLISAVKSLNVRVTEASG